MLAKKRPVISLIVDQGIDSGIDIAVGKLVQAAGDNLPTRVEGVLEPQLTNLRAKVHARKRLSVGLARGIGAFTGNITDGRPFYEIKNPSAAVRFSFTPWAPREGSFYTWLGESALCLSECHLLRFQYEHMAEPQD